MLSQSISSFALLASAGFASVQALATPDATGNAAATCRSIAKSLSKASDVIYPGASNYYEDLRHWTPISQQNSTCVVEVGTAQDVGKALKIIGQTRTPFAVMGAGHSYSPGFSSTKGVHISLYRLKNLQRQKAANTASFGPGYTWLEVYEELQKDGLIAIGGRDSDVGVAGYLLGAGYSWLSQIYGLGFNNVVEYELVKPDGSIVTVNNHTNTDLNFGLKGGYNNFGIVTKFTVKTYPLGKVYAGAITWDGKYLEDVWAALDDHVKHNTDNNCQMIIGSAQDASGIQGLGQLFYNSPTITPAATKCFQKFLAIPAQNSTVGIKSFTDYVLETTFPNNPPGHIYRYVNNGPIFSNVTTNLAHVLVNQSTKYTHDANLPGAQVVGLFEPANPGRYANPLNETAWPNNGLISPFIFAIRYDDPKKDAYAFQASKDACKAMTDAAAAQGDPIDIIYPYNNYVVGDTYTVEQVYGPNLPRLRALAKKHDPNRIMTLAGGWKFQ